MSKILLTSTPPSAGNTKKVLSGINVNTAPTFVGESEYDDFDEMEIKNVMVGVFIDGTWNNRNNTEARLEYEKAKAGKTHDEVLAARYINDDVASFENYYSNVARMEPYYEKQNSEKLISFRVYIEGIGTENFQKDSLIGGGLGAGGTGVVAKVQKACVETVNEISHYGVDEINTLTIDVFGFSRGAAAARNLVHEVSKAYEAEKVVYTYSHGGTPIPLTVPEKPRYGHLGSELKKSETPIRMLIVRFVGIYDTVSSHGIGVLFSYDNDTKALGLDAIRKARFTLHLTAADEHRRNFSLTDITSALSVGRGKEFSLPGVHADLGGSYNNGEEEKRQFDYNESENVINQGWYNTGELKTVRYDRYGRPTVVEGTRTLPNTYSHIPLSVMADFTEKKGLPIKTGPLKSSYAIPSSLNAVKNRIHDYVFKDGKPLNFESKADRALLKPLRRNYLHFSAQYGSLTSGARRKFWSRKRYRKIVAG